MTRTIEQLTARIAELEAENERLKVDRAKKQKESVTIFDVNCELRARVRELEEENARLKEIEQTNDTLLDQLGDKNAALIDEVASQKHCYAEAVAHYEKQLAAEQLNNKRLREALEFLNARIVTMDLGGVVERALSLHASTEALDAYVEQKIKEYN